MAGGNGRPGYAVHISGSLAKTIRGIQRRAKREGRGEAVLAALTQIHERLQRDPWSFGEPLYRLSALRLQVRNGVVRPILVDFAVHEDRPLVFIQGIKLLAD